ncbi:MAG: ATP-binding protein [Chloroflexi bacterium]|nr:ATP-binding protein [Chloroflexota bacterium]
MSVRISLLGKLLLAFLCLIVTVALPVALLNWRTSTREIRRFVSEQERSGFVAEMTDYYRAHGSWAGLLETLHTPGSPPSERPLFSLLDTQGILLLPLGAYRVGRPLPPDAPELRTPIRLEDRVIGTVVTDDRTFALSRTEQALLNRINHNLLFAIIGACLVAIPLSILFARTLLRPIRQLTLASAKIAQGDLEQQVQVNTNDELGDLARAFNQMSRDLARSTYLRRQMTADIAHELRNPLTVLAGYIESIRDHVLQPTPARLDLIYGEIEHLQHLVEDLRTLSKADAGELGLTRQVVAPALLLARVVARYQHQADQQQIRLELNAPTALPSLLLDEERLMQVLGNLVSNALRYTPAHGQIRLSACQAVHTIQLIVQDTGVGIADADLPHIFERFYRADRARQGEDGASGLGLAIAKSLVEAHGGTLTVESTLGQGTTFIVGLPHD